ncbi:MAG: DNA-binding protein WhiA [Ruminococcaceae bacterium]|nr:DNA-binding protein WhiA [Oscillospiraceae bacterium]
MTFSAQVKTELCKIPIEQEKCALAELCGITLFAQAFDARGLRIVTGSAEFAGRISKLFKLLFGFDFDKKITPLGTPKKFSLIIQNRDKLAVLYDAFGFDLETTHIIRLNAALVEDDRTRAAFLRGVFLAGGSVSDPETAYHMEFVTSHYQLSREILALLPEVEIQAKCVTRKGNYVIYLKESRMIEDMLTLIGAPISAMHMMETKMYKELRNSINRKNNFENANFMKMLDTAAGQIAAFEKLDLDALPEKLREAAQVRIDHPDKTMTELCEILGNGVTKSGLNHRFRKLMAMANEGEET